MINDTKPRLEFNRRIKAIQGELDDLGDNKMDLLPIEQVGRFHRIKEEFRVFVKANEHDHD